MRMAILADIHANAESLHAVLEDADRQQVDVLYSLGDNVGYGPEPEAVLRLLRERGIASVMGNHERGIIDTAFQEWFNPVARRSLEITAGLLSEASLAAIAEFPRFRVVDGVRLVHGMPPDDVSAYLFEYDTLDLGPILAALVEPVCFVGHTHELAHICWDGKTARRRSLGRGTVTLAADRRHLVNVGSVGQPRDGDNRAKYAVWDPAARTLDIRYVAYDIAAVAAKIEAAGLPLAGAAMLW